MRNIQSNRLGVPLCCALAGLALLFCSAPLLRAQTWTGNSNGLWNVASNWSSNPSLPTSGIDTTLIFGPSGIGGTALTQNIANPFLINTLTFNNTAPAYTIAGNALDFRFSSTAVIPQFNYNTNNNITLTTPLVLTGQTAVFGSGNGTLSLNGAISGASGLTVNTFATVSLGSASNTFAGVINVSNGTLLLGNGAAIPTGRNVNVFGPGTFSTGGLSNTAATAMGTVVLNDGTFKIPSGSGNYFINALQLNQNTTQSTLDFTGSTNATLHLVNPGAAINVAGNSNWIGAGTSKIVNDTAAPIDIAMTSLTAVNSTLRLANGAAGQGFRITGISSSLVLNAPGSTANLTVDNNSFLSVADMANLGSGVLTLQDTGGTTIPGSLSYVGSSATSSKPITLGPGGGQIFVGGVGTHLTLSGVISESTPGQRLFVSGQITPGPTLELTGVNTYTGPTIIGFGTTLSVSSIPNGGVAGPLGASTSAAANLNIGGGPTGGNSTLQYTGPTAVTNRGMTIGALAPSFSNFEITNPNANLSVTGQLTGVGTLTKTGPGTLTLGNGTNNYSGGTIVSAGKLVSGTSGTPLPAGEDVTVLTGAQLIGSSFSNSLGTAIGTLNLNGGMFLGSPSAATSFFVNRIETDITGGNIDYTGTNTSLLRLASAGAGVTIRGNSTWTGNGAVGSRLTNETGATIDLVVNPGVTWTNGFSLFSGAFRLTGGGTLFETGASNSANLTVEGARFRVDNVANLPTNSFTFNGGTLEYSGPNATSPRAITLGDGGIDFSVTNPASILTYNGTLSGNGPVVKSGPGVLVLNVDNTLQGGLTISNGRIDVASENLLGVANPTVNPLGTLRYTSTATTSRIFNLVGGALEIAAGQTLTLSGASVGGGILRGDGAFAIGGGTSIAGATTLTSTVITQTGPASFANFTNNGLLVNAPAQTLTWNGGTNTSAGRFIVNGTANVNDFVSNGQLTIPAGGTVNNSISSLVLGGGSTTTVGSIAIPGGAINLGGQTLELRGGLLANNGTISNGTVNVNFGGVAKGSGVYPTVNVFDGGKFSPGNSPGTVTTGSTSWGAGGGYLFEINDAAGTQGVNWDLWNINGGLSITAGTTTNSRFTLSIASLDVGNAPGNAANFNNTQNYSWLIASTTAGITGFATNKFTLDSSTFTNPIGAGSFALNQIGNNLFLNFNAGSQPPPQWNVDASGSWSTAANWQPTVVPNDPAASANFLGKITAPRTVTLDGDKTVGAIYFDNANSYTIAPGSGGTLTVVGGVDPSGQNISVFSGSHTISAALAVGASTGYSIKDGASLTISGPFSIASGVGLAGGGGVLTISGPQNHGIKSNFDVEGVGQVNFNSNAGSPASAATAAIANLSIDVGANASLTFNANQDIHDLGLATHDGPEHVNLASPGGAGAFRAIHVYSGDLAASKTALYASLVSANRAGAPDPTVGIFDSGRGLHSNSGIGIALINDAHGDPSVFIRLTRIGDLNLDGQVTISDFIDLASHFGGTGTWQEGDLNYDNQITISDFIDLASNFGSTYSGEVFPISPQDQQTLASFAAAHGASVPEPSALFGLIFNGFALGARLRRK